jgi:UDP:flavonoid glycosyltransferase YjiC (YdhE family)
MTFNTSRKNILVAPLNWGLGHATRCIPIIRELEKNGFNPIIASDGIALDLLKKEFPHITCLELPSYTIQYSKKGTNLKWKLLKNSLRITKAIVSEKKLVKRWMKDYNLIGIISDNRFGIRNKKIKSVFITHQVNVLSGKTTWISSKLHQFFISKFDQCWVPDLEKTPNFSGVLGHLKEEDPNKLNLKYIGILSRFEKKELPKKYDLMVILSGPEPQRTILEEKIISELKNYKGNVIFIKGKVEAIQEQELVDGVIFYNFMQSEQLEKIFNESDVVLCRSGYTTVMDLAKLEKKAFFIPTPGQYEQEYLAERLKENGIVSYSKQDFFKIENLKEIYEYKGFSLTTSKIDWPELFEFF